MELLPKKTSLVVETVNALKEWIRTGILSEVVPGELELKQRLGVGRDTLRGALKLLEEEGWLTPATKGRQRRVQRRPLAPAQSLSATQLPVAFLSPYAIAHRVTLLEMEDTQVRLAEEGRKLLYLAPAIFHLKSPERQLERLVQTHPSAAWVLYITSGPIQRWFDQQGLPAFLYEMPFPGVNLPYVAPDWEEAAFHAGVQLVRQGHRVVGVLEYQERRPGLVAEERGLERALATVEPKGRLVVFKDEHTPPTVARSLQQAFSLRERPTALVLTRAAQVLTCYSWLASRGIRVPDDVSLVSLPNDSWFDEFCPPITYYKPNTKVMSRNIAERVMELVATGKVTRKSVRVPLSYVPGATIARVPGGN